MSAGWWSVDAGTEAGVPQGSRAPRGEMSCEASLVVRSDAVSPARSCAMVLGDCGSGHGSSVACMHRQCYWQCMDALHDHEAGRQYNTWSNTLPII